jgi:Ca2+-binding RTX toxin-like protein
MLCLDPHLTIGLHLCCYLMRGWVRGMSCELLDNGGLDSPSPLRPCSLLALIVAAGAALTATFDRADATGDVCTGSYKDDKIRGTDAPDNIDALNGADTVWGLKGADEFHGAVVSGHWGGE